MTINKKQNCKSGREIIHFEDIFKTFGGNHVLEGLDLTVKEGETLTIIGGSGSGKSVMLKLLLGLIPPDSGDVLFEGDDVCRMKEEELIEKIADAVPSPQQILEKKERSALIRKAIDSLPAKQRMATILQIYEELSYKEISRILGCSVKSVERRLYWARTNLKERLSSYLTRESSGGF